MHCQRWVLVVAIGVVTTVACLRARPAGACSEAYGLTSRAVVPGPDRTNVPVNAEVVVVVEGPARLVAHEPILREAGGGEVAVSIERVSTFDRLAVRMRPAGDLAEDTRYEVLDRTLIPCFPAFDDPAECALDEPVVIAAFETGRRIDTTPPVFAGLDQLDSDFTEWDDDCTRGLQLTVDLAWRAATDDSDDADVRYNVYGADDTLRAAYVDGQALRGSMFCDGDDVSTSTVGAPGAFSVRAVDVAGNEDDNTVRLDSAVCADYDSGCGCAAGGDGGAPSPVWVVAAAAGFAVVRRRRA